MDRNKLVSKIMDYLIEVAAEDNREPVRVACIRSLTDITVALYSSPFELGSEPAQPSPEPEPKRHHEIEQKLRKVVEYALKEYGAYVTLARMAREALDEADEADAKDAAEEGVTWFQGRFTAWTPVPSTNSVGIIPKLLYTDNLKVGARVRVTILPDTDEQGDVPDAD